MKPPLCQDVFEMKKLVNKSIRKPIKKPDPKLQTTLNWREKEIEKPAVSYHYGPIGSIPKYDLRKHNKDFDPWKHGYVWKNGFMFYRRPDGVDVPAFAGVNEITDKGELKPLC